MAFTAYNLSFPEGFESPRDKELFYMSLPGQDEYENNLWPSRMAKQTGQGPEVRALLKLDTEKVLKDAGREHPELHPYIEKELDIESVLTEAG